MPLSAWVSMLLGKNEIMSDNDKIGYANPPKNTRWKKGQSGNPRGRPKTKSEMVKDAARILTQPVDARGPGGDTIRLDAIEAAYLALCRKGLKGHKTSLLGAIHIMLEVGPAVEAEEASKAAEKQKMIETLERLGVKVPKDSQ